MMHIPFRVSIFEASAKGAQQLQACYWSWALTVVNRVSPKGAKLHVELRVAVGAYLGE